MYFLYVFDSFPPFLCKRVKCSPFLCPRVNRSSLVCYFLKRDLSDSILSLFTKKWPWTICLGPSWQNSKCEQFAHAAHDKRAKGAICSFLRANHCFTHKKRANHWKNQWANSQPCIFNTQKWHVRILQMFFQRLQYFQVYNTFSLLDKFWRRNNNRQCHEKIVNLNVQYAKWSTCLSVKHILSSEFFRQDSMRKFLEPWS